MALCCSPPGLGPYSLPLAKSMLLATCMPVRSQKSISFSFAACFRRVSSDVVARTHQAPLASDRPAVRPAAEFNVSAMTLNELAQLLTGVKPKGDKHCKAKTL